MTAYYNEIDSYAARWLENLISENMLPYGHVDVRDIRDVSPSDLVGFSHCHFFAGIGGWAHAAQLAGWPDDRPLWTGSCPCQPFSNAGRRDGFADERHLWPEWFRLIRAGRPPVVVGEQVAAATSGGWLDRVFDDLEGEGYASRAAIIPACAVGAPHRRDRLWFVAHPDSGGRASSPFGESDAERNAEPCGALVNATRIGRGERWSEHEVRGGRPAATSPSSAGGLPFWNDAEWIRGGDDKTRRVKPGVRLLAHGVPARVAKLRALGNAIVPAVAAEILAALME